MSRRVAFSAARGARVLRGLRRGLTIKAAAAAARLHYHSVQYWIQKGLAGVAPFVRFGRQAERLRAEAVERELWSRVHEVFAQLRQGRALAAAQEAVGIYRRRWRRWVRLGEAGQPPYAEFVKQLRAVQAGTQRCCKLTPARARRLIRLVEQGRRHGQAARRAGITKNTLVQWLKWGRAGRQPFAELAAGIEAAAANLLHCRAFKPARVRKLLAALAQGKSARAACRAARVAYSTFWRWLKAGQAGKTPLVDFAARVRAARRRAERRRMRQAWSKLRRESWRTAARRLTRRDPENWSLRRIMARELRALEEEIARLEHTEGVGSGAWGEEREEQS